jgi:hypothetical protein
LGGGTWGSCWSRPPSPRAGDERPDLRSLDERSPTNDPHGDAHGYVSGTNGTRIFATYYISALYVVHIRFHSLLLALDRLMNRRESPEPVPRGAPNKCGGNRRNWLLYNGLRKSECHSCQARILTHCKPGRTVFCLSLLPKEIRDGPQVGLQRGGALELALDRSRQVRHTIRPGEKGGRSAFSSLPPPPLASWRVWRPWRENSFLLIAHAQTLRPSEREPRSKGSVAPERRSRPGRVPGTPCTALALPFHAQTNPASSNSSGCSQGDS